MKKSQIIMAVIATLAIVFAFAACKKSSKDDKLVTDANGVAVTDEEGNTAYYAVTDSKGRDYKDKDGSRIAAVVTDADGEPFTDEDGKFIYSAVTKVKVTEEDGKIVVVTKKDGSPVYELVTDKHGNIKYTSVTNKYGEKVFENGTYRNGDSAVITKAEKNSKKSTTKKHTVKHDGTSSKTTKKVTKAPTTALQTTTAAQKIFYTASEVYSFGYGSTGDDKFADVVATSDGGYVAIAMGSVDNGDFSPVQGKGARPNYNTVIKFNSQGKAIWKTHIYGNKGIDLKQVAVLNDGSVVAVGSTQSTDLGVPALGLLDGYIVKLSSKGNIVFSKLIGGTNHEYAECVCATPDGGFIIGGKTLSVNGSFKNYAKEDGGAFIMKFTGNGYNSWTHIYGGEKSDLFCDISVNSDGAVFALCQTYSSMGDFGGLGLMGKLDTVIFKFNKNGGLSWKKPYTSSGEDRFNTITATKDGGCVVGGGFNVKDFSDGNLKNFHNAGGFDAVIFKLKSDGSIAWEKNLSGFLNEQILSVENYGRGYIAAGISASNNRDFDGIKNKGDYDIFLWYIDGNGNTKMLDSFAGTDSDTVSSICVLKDNTIVICGHTKSTDGDFSKMKRVPGDISIIAFLAKLKIS